MATRSKSEIARDMKAWLKARVRVVDTGSKTTLHALVMEAWATALASAHSALADVQTAQGISDPGEVANLDLDDLAYNFSLTRKSAQAATGYVTFRRSVVPTSTVLIGKDDGTGGVLVAAGRDASGAAVTFETTQSVFFTTSTAKNPVTGLYEVSAPIRALQSGASGNKAAGTIKLLSSPANSVDSITNKTATTGGEDEEANEDFAKRLISKILGLQPGVEEGLRSLALGHSGVKDAAVAGPDDDSFQRSPIGAVDLIIKGSAESTALDQFLYSDPTAHVFENRPVNDVTSVISTVGLTQGGLTEGAQWQFSQDLVGEDRLSTTANDHLSWLGSSLPNSGAKVEATYSYDTLIKTIQDAVDLDSNHYPAAVVKVKKATAVNIDISFTVKRTGAVTSDILRDRISTALTNYIDGLKLGSTVKQSNLVTVIKGVSGVRTITTPITKLARRGNIGVSDVTLTPYEYPDLDEQSLTITITT